MQSRGSIANARKTEIIKRLNSVEHRLYSLRNRKILCSNAEEHAILRFQIIDERHERARLMNVFEKTK
jgi:hypothetical protein